MSLKKKSANSAVILFSVKDTGIGIKNEKLETIFDSFKQESPETTRQYGGTGLGLSITKELVQLMGGEIKVESVAGKGSRFYFYLKMDVAKNVTKYNSSETEKADAFLSNINILLVDDNQLNRDVFIDLISDDKNNVTIDTAEDGVKAIEKFKKNNYDVILMDLQMPNMDGYQTTMYIRENFPVEKNEIPIIAMTAHVIEGISEKCLAAGMTDCVSKPINTYQLSQLINQLLNRESESNVPIDKNTESNNKKEDSVIDLSMIKKISKNNNEKIIKYINLYLESVPMDLEKMKKALQEKKFTALSKIAHKLKGNAGYMGLNELLLCLDKLENLIENDEKSNEIIIIVNRVESIITLSIDELKSYKKQCLT